MNDTARFGYWPLSILMIVVASWILYRFLAPKGWREWSRAGLVEAFIIALYAEMYGFPLTLYLLTGFLGVEIPLVHTSGHLWAAVFGWGVAGELAEMAAGYALLFLGLTVLAEGWREVYRASHEGRLADDRLYGVVRHPQYLGIFLAVFGQIVHWPTLPTLVLSPAIVWAYYRLAAREERAMIERFGDAYRDYASRVPMFLPRHHPWRQLTDALRTPAGPAGAREDAGRPGTRTTV